MDSHGINSNVRDMDDSLKEEIYWFMRIKFNYTVEQGKDFADELENHLKSEGFDLGCVVKYKNKKEND